MYSKKFYNELRNNNNISELIFNNKNIRLWKLIKLLKKEEES